MRKIVSARKSGRLMFVVFEDDKEGQYDAYLTQQRYEATVAESKLLTTLNEEQTKLYKKCVELIREADAEDRIYD